MLYAVLRAIAGVSLRWYYRDILVQGRDNVPADGPVLVVANHPNALVDALLVATTLSRRVLITGKATLFEHPAMASLLGAIGVLPLRRLQDEGGAVRPSAIATRNEDALAAVTAALRGNGVVLVFPEGISHDQPSLAPMRSGASRMALRARDAGVNGLRVLPIGLVFEQKERPGSRVLVRIGPPIDVDALDVAGELTGAAALTSRIALALRSVTLGFASEERAARAVRLARALVALDASPQALAADTAFLSEVEIAGRIERATEGLGAASPELVQRADVLVDRVAALERHAASLGVTLEDARMPLAARSGAWFTLRELGLLTVAGPVAALGRAIHWPPIAVARTVALRTLANDPSRDQPAMRTILGGLVLIPAWYALQAALVTWWQGPAAALGWLAVIIGAGQVHLALGHRPARAWARVRTYLALRRSAAAGQRLLSDMDALLAEAMALEAALTAR